MQIYKQNYNKLNDTMQTYRYHSTEVVIITVFKTGKNSIAIVENISTGEQFEVFRNQLV